MSREVRELIVLFVNWERFWVLRVARIIWFSVRNRWVMGRLFFEFSFFISWLILKVLYWLVVVGCFLRRVGSVVVDDFDCFFGFWISRFFLDFIFKFFWFKLRIFFLFFKIILFFFFMSCLEYLCSLWVVFFVCKRCMRLTLLRCDRRELWCRRALCFIVFVGIVVGFVVILLENM